jgi:hypothetical protein
LASDQLRYFGGIDLEAGYRIPLFGKFAGQRKSYVSEAQNTNLGGVLLNGASERRGDHR